MDCTPPPINTQVPTNNLDEQHRFSPSLMPASPHNLAKPLRRTFINDCRFCPAENSLRFLDCRTDGKREICLFERLNPALRVDFERISENLPGFREFGL